MKKHFSFSGIFLTAFLLFSHGSGLKAEEQSVKEKDLLPAGSFEKCAKKGASAICTEGQTVWVLASSRAGKGEISFGEDGDVEWEMEKGKPYKGDACLKLTNRSRDVTTTINSTPPFVIKGGRSYIIRFVYRGEYLSYDKCDMSYRIIFFSDAQGKLPVSINKYICGSSGKHREPADAWVVIEKKFVAPDEAVKGYLTFYCHETGVWRLDDVSLCLIP